MTNTPPQKGLWGTFGGTFDAKKYAEPAPDDIEARKPSGIPGDLARIGLEGRFDFMEVCHADSKYVEPAHIEQFLAYAEAHPEYTDLRISLGTDALSECATYIEREMDKGRLEGRTIILVAAMAPLANEHAPAWETLREAAESLGKYPPGLYVMGDDRSKIEPFAVDGPDGTERLFKNWAEPRRFEYGSAPTPRPVRPAKAEAPER